MFTDPACGTGCWATRFGETDTKHYHKALYRFSVVPAAEVQHEAIDTAVAFTFRDGSVDSSTETRPVQVVCGTSSSAAGAPVLTITGLLSVLATSSVGQARFASRKRLYLATVTGSSHPAPADRDHHRRGCHCSRCCRHGQLHSFCEVSMVLTETNVYVKEFLLIYIINLWLDQKGGQRAF